LSHEAIPSATAGTEKKMKLAAAALLMMFVLPALPAMAKSADGEPQSCAKQVGVKKANVYVEQCALVSLASHPPCNKENSCTLIVNSIIIGCSSIRHALVTHPEWGKAAPGVPPLFEPSFCAPYLKRSDPRK
jgi:hypothetical protein